MKELGLSILKKIYDYGYVGYIVGGYVRDTLLGIETNDIDITTNATPMELKNIFPDLVMTSESYGSVKIEYKKHSFDITTFREEEGYLDNRHPTNVKYVNDLKTDLLRRDFTVNTLCMDKDGHVLDLLNAKVDLDNKKLKTVIDSDRSFSLDALRMLRAIRFSVNLGLTMSDDIIASIHKNSFLLKKLSYERKKSELDKIFGSNKAKEGILLLKEYGLDEILEIDLTRIVDYSDIIGIWAMINSSKYPFTNTEKDLIKKVNIVYDMDNLDPKILYKYGVYVNVLAGVNKGINKKDILEKYENLPIKSKDDILINAKEICELLHKKPGNFLGKLYEELETKILDKEILNNKEELIKYIKGKEYE